jgi:hypothetical protein
MKELDKEETLVLEKIKNIVILKEIIIMKII